MKAKRSIKILFTVGVFLLGAGSFQSAAGQDDDQSKAIKAEEFVKTRPAAKRPAANARYKPAVKSATSPAPAAPPQGMVFAQMGVTIWRFRPTTAADKTKELVEEVGGGEPTQWTLERVEEGTPLSPGQRVRLSLESLSRDGYLYVIDREQYADGTMGDAHLIFPTKRTRDGDNRVKAGRLIYIPAPPNYFRIKPSQSSKVHVAEVLTILVSPQPLIDASLLSTKSITLPRERVESWEKQWGAPATRFEMDGGAGQTMTEKEQAAGADNSQELTQDDPVPQTIYRVAIKPESPLLVTVPLKFGKAN